MGHKFLSGIKWNQIQMQPLLCYENSNDLSIYQHMVCFKTWNAVILGTSFTVKQLWAYFNHCVEQNLLVAASLIKADFSNLIFFLRSLVPSCKAYVNVFYRHVCVLITKTHFSYNVYNLSISVLIEGISSDMENTLHQILLIQYHSFTFSLQLILLYRE